MNKGAIILLVLILALTSSLLAMTADADARRGADFFQSQGCVNCHAVKGSGAGKAADLGRRLDRDYTPAGIAACSLISMPLATSKSRAKLSAASDSWKSSAAPNAMPSMV